MFRYLKIFSEYPIRNSLSTNHPLSFVRHKKKSAVLEHSIDRDCFITVRTIPNDYPEILDLFHRSFMREEPTLVAAGLCNKSNPILDEIFIDKLCQGLSVVVRCRCSGEICGFAVNGGACAWDGDEADKIADNCQCTKTANLLRFLANINRAPDFWRKYCQMKLFEISYLTVARQFRQKGLAVELIKTSREYGRDMGFQIIRVDATSAYTAMVCQKLNMKLIQEIDYKSHLGPDGHPMYFPPPPHGVVKIFADLPLFLEKKK